MLGMSRKIIEIEKKMRQKDIKWLKKKIISYVGENHMILKKKDETDDRKVKRTGLISPCNHKPTW